MMVLMPNVAAEAGEYEHVVGKKRRVPEILSKELAQGKGAPERSHVRVALSLVVG